jgi:hypothetical protein
MAGYRVNFTFLHLVHQTTGETILKESQKINFRFPAEHQSFTFCGQCKASCRPLEVAPLIDPVFPLISMCLEGVLVTCLILPTTHSTENSHIMSAKHYF